MATQGYDVFLLAPGSVDQMACRICGTACAVVRNVKGPTSYASAITKTVSLHDRFTCPHSGMDWHAQALHLAEAIEASPSPRMAQQMRLDLADLLQANRVGQTVH